MGNRRPSFGLLPVGAAAGLLSDIEAIENQCNASVGEGTATAIREQGYLDPMSGLPDCQLETAPNKSLKRKTLHFYGVTFSHHIIQKHGNYFRNLPVVGEVWSDSRRLNSSPMFVP